MNCFRRKGCANPPRMIVTNYYYWTYDRTVVMLNIKYYSLLIVYGYGPVNGYFNGNANREVITVPFLTHYSGVLFCRLRRVASLYSLALIDRRLNLLVDALGVGYPFPQAYGINVLSNGKPDGPQPQDVLNSGLN